jgi:hypothetical protein
LVLRQGNLARGVAVALEWSECRLSPSSEIANS